MRGLLIASTLVLALAGGPAALAHKHAKAAQAADASPSTTASKSADCTRQWNAELSHNQPRKAFMAACKKA
ncbi:hypothetical protein [Phenylobacterium sp.]|uniref:hypothetical protein n=1 Tax=Phenylobacterium sp. TaxID=1871053 RepID=UPI002601009B|nr:hypothetical protein [Phenylobacterium sp.]